MGRWKERKCTAVSKAPRTNYGLGGSQRKAAHKNKGLGPLDNDAPHERNVHTQAAMNTRAVKANKHTVGHRGPGRTAGVAVKAGLGVRGARGLVKGVE